MRVHDARMTNTLREQRTALTIQQRDALILMARRYDIPVPTIAEALGITASRVYQIIKDAQVSK